MYGLGAGAGGYGLYNGMYGPGEQFVSDRKNCGYPKERIESFKKCNQFKQDRLLGDNFNEHLLL